MSIVYLYKLFLAFSVLCIHEPSVLVFYYSLFFFMCVLFTSIYHVGIHGIVDQTYGQVILYLNSKEVTM